ncbi:hypothetical protein SASPL_103726 [Salvia splendens]|uniref:CBS domain-containing protein n=1 Tax=Salvia splendens TaxID=180675 RepID=A0A8X9A726_SALSN|nr:hypothetical protein SASPL_103726 [Salvia splendens]
MYRLGMDYTHESGIVLIPTRFVWPYGGRVVYISGSFTGQLYTYADSFFSLFRGLVYLMVNWKRWTQWPMTPVEGCPTVFQTICSLPPGYHQVGVLLWHLQVECVIMFSCRIGCDWYSWISGNIIDVTLGLQYKFVVDGEWRHDDRQPSISSNLGTVNTILLTTESAMLTPQMPPAGPGFSMDVDNGPHQRVVPVPDVTSRESFPVISESDLEISRHRIAVFMSTHMAYELLPESGKVVAFDVDLPVKQAFHILHEQVKQLGCLYGAIVGLLKEPVCRSSQCTGFYFNYERVLGLRLVCVRSWTNVSAGGGKFDKTAYMLMELIAVLGTHGSNLTEEELETHTISAWKEAKLYLNSQVNGSGSGVSRQLVQAGPDDSLKDVALKILQNGVATIPILHSLSVDASNPHLLHLASLSGILKCEKNESDVSIMCIFRFFKHSPASLPILQLPIGAIPVGTWVPKIGEPDGRPLAMLRPSASLSAALNLLLQAQVSSVPIVDDNDSLLDVYARSDITTLAKDKIYTHINLEETTIHQALQYRDDPFSVPGPNSQRWHMCLRTDPLLKVLERLSQPGVRRLIIVEAGSKRVQGIVSLSDVFRFLLGI